MYMYNKNIYPSLSFWFCLLRFFIPFQVVKCKYKKMSLDQLLHYFAYYFYACFFARTQTNTITKLWFTCSCNQLVPINWLHRNFYVEYIYAQIRAFLTSDLCFEWWQSWRRKGNNIFCQIYFTSSSSVVIGMTTACSSAERIVLKHIIFFIIIIHNNKQE